MSRSRKRPYTKSRIFSTSCRNRGSCPWCRGNRLCSRHRAEEAAREQVEEFVNEGADLEEAEAE